jgi:Zn-dependent peptidase ImmA (M78 family)/DNA-binding XRE family transcriptional regulator
MANGVGPEAAAASDVAVLFDRHRLRLARELRGLSQVDLAREVGSVRAASLSQFEQGHAKPAATTLYRLAVALQVPVTFFATPTRPDRAGTNNGFFRSLRSTPPRERQRALARAELAREIVREIETIVRLPELDVPRAQPHVSESTGIQDIERIADEIRQRWNLPAGPVDDMVLQLERHGIVTTRFDVGHAKIDAFSVPFPDRPIVVLGADKDIRDRSRFDAAHELAHLVLHREDQAGSKIIETQAHQFAAAFLMPAKDIAHQLPSKADWNHLIRLKAYWHVSIAALLKRARTLGVMSEPTYVQALKIMSVRGWRKTEPGDLGRPEQPVLLRRAADAAKSVGVSLSDVSQRAGLPEAEVYSIVGMDDDRPAVEL